jgi:hypothetical protein
MPDSSNSYEKEEDDEEEDEDELPQWDKKKSFGSFKITKKITFASNSLPGWNCMAISKKTTRKFAIKFVEFVEDGTVGFTKFPNDKKSGNINPNGNFIIKRGYSMHFDNGNLFSNINGIDSVLNFYNYYFR